MHNIRICELFDLEKTIAKELFKDKEYPWEVLPNIKDFIIELGKTLPKETFNEVKENVWIAKSAKVFDSAYIAGPCIIDENTEIRQCAFVRGSAIIGKNVVLGNSCEVKDTILFVNVQVPHFNYVGDSVLGYKSHIGAGGITSNVKSDKTLVTIKEGEEKIETNLKKVGAMIGDNVEVGCNSVLCPGTVIGRGTTIYPLSMVRGVVKENSIYKSERDIVERR